jgi:hypothetical protein
MVQKIRAVFDGGSCFEGRSLKADGGEANEEGQMDRRKVPVKVDSMEHAANAIPGSSEGTLEVTALGMIACLIIAFWSLVGDGTLPLSAYLVFVAFLLVSAVGLVWRILKHTPRIGTESGAPQKPGIQGQVSEHF